MPSKQKDAAVSSKAAPTKVSSCSNATVKSTGGNGTGTKADRRGSEASGANGLLQRFDSIWMKDDEAANCVLCDTNFTLFTRRHHCRACGALVCNDCSKSRHIVLTVHATEPQRVCDKCARPVKATTKPQSAPSGSKPSSAAMRRSSADDGVSNTKARPISTLDSRSDHRLKYSSAEKPPSVSARNSQAANEYARKRQERIDNAQRMREARRSSLPENVNGGVAGTKPAKSSPSKSSRANERATALRTETKAGSKPSAASARPATAPPATAPSSSAKHSTAQRTAPQPSSGKHSIVPPEKPKPATARRKSAENAASLSIAPATKAASAKPSTTPRERTQTSRATTQPSTHPNPEPRSRTSSIDGPKRAAPRSDTKREQKENDDRAATKQSVNGIAAHPTPIAQNASADTVAHAAGDRVESVSERVERELTARTEGSGMCSSSPVTNELVESERKYNAFLHVAVEVFGKPMKHKQLINDGDYRSMFGEIEVIKNYSAMLLSGLEDAKHWADVASVLLMFAKFVKVYTSYTLKYDAILTTLGAWLKNKDKASWLQATSLKPECAGLDLSALMIMPIQRVPRYSMLLKEMIKVRRGSVEPQLTEASSLIDDALVVINEKKREAERMQQVVKLQVRLKDAQCFLVTPTRLMIKEGSLFEIFDKQCEATCMALFNDGVLWAKETRTQTLRFRRLLLFAEVSDIKAFCDVDSKDWSRMVADGYAGFELTASDQTISFGCSSPAERDRWHDAIVQAWSSWQDMSAQRVMSMPRSK